MTAFPACIPNEFSWPNGESLSLSQAEREAVAQAVIDEAGGRATVYIQCGAATVRETEALVRHAISAGADGAGVMTPVFFALDDEAIYRYYASILDGVGDFPIYAYNIPPRAGNDLSPSVLGALMGRYGAQGVKYSYPTTAKVLDYLVALPQRAGGQRRHGASLHIVRRRRMGFRAFRRVHGAACALVARNLRAILYPAKRKTPLSNVPTRCGTFPKSLPSNICSCGWA